MEKEMKTSSSNFPSSRRPAVKDAKKILASNIPTIDDPYYQSVLKKSKGYGQRQRPRTTRGKTSIVLERCETASKESEWNPYSLSKDNQQQRTRQEMNRKCSSDMWETHLEEGTLDIPHLGLRKLPKTIFQFDPPLSIIYLSDNKIQKLPSSFFDRLTSLSWLDVRNNRLKALPELSQPHNSLRIILAQNNKIFSIPYSLVLATVLRNISLSGNPLVEPPKDVIKKGTSGILKYCSEKFQYVEGPPERIYEKGVHVQDTSDDDDDDDDDDDNEDKEFSVKEDQNKGKFIQESKLLNALTRRIAAAHVSEDEQRVELSRKSSDKDMEKMKKMSYSWELWRDTPYEGVELKKVLQASLKDMKEGILKKFNIDRDLVLQRVRNVEALKTWRNDSWMMKLNNKFSPNYSGFVSPFGTDADTQLNVVDERCQTKILSPDEFQEEFKTCLHELANLSSNPTPITNVSEALARVKKVEAIQRKVCGLKLSLKQPHPQ